MASWQRKSLVSLLLISEGKKYLCAQLNADTISLPKKRAQTITGSGSSLSQAKAKTAHGAFSIQVPLENCWA